RPTRTTDTGRSARGATSRDTRKSAAGSRKRPLRRTSAASVATSRPSAWRVYAGKSRAALVSAPFAAPQRHRCFIRERRFRTKHPPAGPCPDEPFHREPRGFELKPVHAAVPRESRVFLTRSRLACRLLSHGVRRRTRNGLVGRTRVVRHGDRRARSRGRALFQRRGRNGAHRAHRPTAGRGCRSATRDEDGCGPLPSRAGEGVTLTRPDAPTAVGDDMPPERNDGELGLLERLRRGDPAAATELVERYAERAYRVAFAITRDAEDAEAV